MAEAGLGQTIGPAVALMGAAVIVVPLFRLMVPAAVIRSTALR
jgi:glutathione-regulated potassium-efflux system protein KefB